MAGTFGWPPSPFNHGTFRASHTSCIKQIPRISMLMFGITSIRLFFLILYSLGSKPIKFSPSNSALLLTFILRYRLPPHLEIEVRRWHAQTPCLSHQRCSGNGAIYTSSPDVQKWLARAKKPSYIKKNYIHLNCRASSPFLLRELRPTTHDLPRVCLFH
jgi:hypothetical protein